MSDPPKYRPLERFWPYADLPEQPTDEELAVARSGSARGAVRRPAAAVLDHAGVSAARRARLRRARWRSRAASAEYRETGAGATLRHRARFWSSDAVRLRDLFEIVGRSDATDVLIDDRPVPYARELWLPLVWFLIPR